jgi:hypothetical protein
VAPSDARYEMFIGVSLVISREIGPTLCKCELVAN